MTTREHHRPPCGFWLGLHGPYAFLLDTGSSISSVSRQLATGLSLPRTGKVARISAHSVAGLLGSDELRHFGEVTIDFRHLRLQLGTP